MKTVLVAINSKYIHSSLSVRYLKASCDDGCGDVNVKEFTINDNLEGVFSAIYCQNPDNVAFSCYIWNIEFIFRICENLKRVLPDAKLILGGPEVSFDSEAVLKCNSYIDFILAGEGEISFYLLLKKLNNNVGEFTDIPGLTFRTDGNILSSGCSSIVDLGKIPSPYTEEMLANLGNRIVYYESSRGCPFSCSYCLSSTFEGVRYFSMERVKADLERLIKSGVKQVKFVDRTFNSSRKRAKEILEFITDCCRRQMDSDTLTKVPNFHFEAAADLFDAELLEIMAKAPKGLFQLEIGIQTTNLKTLELIDRKTDLTKIFNNTARILESGNIHVHLDLIAGLPGEDYMSFINSFNEVYSLGPHNLQLGFLKMLKGSRVRGEAKNYGYVFREYPPYEILSSKYISYKEILELKSVEEILERYYNSGRFQKSLEYILKEVSRTPYEFYKDYYFFCRDKGRLELKTTSRQLYTWLLDFILETSCENNHIIVKNLLKLDYLGADNSNNLPDGIGRHVEGGFKEKCFEFLKNSRNISIYLPDYIGFPAKQIIKKVHFEPFEIDVLPENKEYQPSYKTTTVLFDYSKKDPVTGLYHFQKLQNF